MITKIDIGIVFLITLFVLVIALSNILHLDMELVKVFIDGLLFLLGLASGKKISSKL